MAGYLGDEGNLAVQRALSARQPELAGEPLLSSGGRIPNLLDPDGYGWDRVMAEAERHRMVGLTRVERESTLARLAGLRGRDRAFRWWQTFTGAAAPPPRRRR